MKKVYLVGFRGTGFRSEQYKAEPLLIRAGHVGFTFEDDPNLIYGFHPTEEAAQSVGDDQAVINWLKTHKVLEGAIQDNTAIFRHAYDLAQAGAVTTVWQIVIELEDETFERVREQAERWYNQRKLFLYSFPPTQPMDDRDNCATFPRKLGLPLPEPTGNLREYIPALEAYGERWSPKGD